MKPIAIYETEDGKRPFKLWLDGEKLVLVLSGGDKSTQEKDIKLAHEYWNDYLRRSQNEKNK